MCIIVGNEKDLTD